MTIEVIVEDDLNIDEMDLPFEAWHTAVCQRMARESALTGQRMEGDICVSLVGNAQSKALNLMYRNQDKPTNVLSFPAEVDLPEVNVLGDLAICYPLVVTEAGAQRKSTSEHLAHLFVHGVLHLLGYDHEAPDEALAMEDLERDILVFHKGCMFFLRQLLRIQNRSISYIHPR